MLTKKKIWSVLTLIVFLLLILNPERLALALFIQVVGLDFLYLFIEIQIIGLATFLFRDWLIPLFMPVYVFIKKIDPYFFVPTLNTVKRYPLLSVHGVPGLLLLYYSRFFVKVNLTNV